MISSEKNRDLFEVHYNLVSSVCQIYLPLSCTVGISFMEKLLG